jgi:hypothetical protein
VFNIGSNIANYSAFQQDGLVMRYGYVMRHVRATRILTSQGTVFKSGPSTPVVTTYQVVRKDRVQATPYGFGLNPSGFTAKQWAILGALGLSRAPGVF